MSLLRALFSPSPEWTDVVFWAVDLETEGLDPKRDEILSVGMVPVRGGVIRMGEAFASLVRPEEGHAPAAGALGAHHLRPVDMLDAPPLASVLPEVAGRLAGNVLLLHHAAIEVGFFKRVFPRHGLVWPSPTVVDTVTLLRRWAQRRRLLGDPHFDVGLDLLAARRALGLPFYPPHDALTDATATAELFLALRARLDARTLRHLL